MNVINVFTDGSCTRNGKTGARGGIGVFFADGDPRNFSGPQIGPRHSNQLGELQAIRKCLEILYPVRNSAKIVLYTDSMYGINCLTKWIVNWKKSGWKNSKKQDVAHKELIQEIDRFHQSYRSIELRHVRSHQIEPHDKRSEAYMIWYGNFKADELASKQL